MEWHKNPGIETWRRLLRVHRVVLEKLRREMDHAHALPLAWFDVLVQLQAAKGRLRMTELADSVLLSSSGLTRLVDRMEGAGLLRREPCSDDRRGHWAMLTDAGKLLAKKAASVHARGIREHFLAHLSEEEVATLGDAFAKILHTEDPAATRD